MIISKRVHGRESKKVIKIKMIEAMCVTQKDKETMLQISKSKQALADISNYAHL